MKRLIPAMAAVVFACSCGTQPTQQVKENGDPIKINQIGYPTKGVKIAILSDSADQEFVISDFTTGKEVYKGKTSEPKEWPFSGTKVRTADFSDFNKEGIYTIISNGTGASHPFVIGNDIYQDLIKQSLHTFYLARSGEEIRSEFAGKYARPAAHPDLKVKIHKSAAGPKRKEGEIISSPGGWYDAGDFNKYVVNSSITVWELLHACELYPEYVNKLKLNIPETENELPDLIDEILVNLKWMLTMQDPDDGGVYSKLTSLNFCGFIMPQDDDSERYVIQKTTAATLDFVATLCKAERVLRNYPELEDFCNYIQGCYMRAYNWAVKNKDILYRQPEDVRTGQYNDDRIGDEWTWACIEFFISYEDELPMEVLPKDYYRFSVPCWDSTSTMAAISLLNNKKACAFMERHEKELLDYITEGFFKLADELLATYEQSAYKVPLDVFPWGSNSECANRGIVLMTAYRVTGNQKYLEAAQAAFHYILGRNPLDYCYVTGFGSKSPKDPHDRRSVADSIPDPAAGYLVGGPFVGGGNECGHEPNKFAALNYYDTNASYTTNEIAINWQAALVLLSIMMENE